MDEIKIMHETHFMTKRNKILIQEKKALENELGELELSKKSMETSFKQSEEQNKLHQQQMLKIKE